MNYRLLYGQPLANNFRLLKQKAVKKNLLKLTGEQTGIINTTGNIKINAVAGSGKTTTLIQYAATRPQNSRILYLAFNRSVKTEAKKRFAHLGLHNVQVETAHSLAYNFIMPSSGFNIRASGYSSFETAQILKLAGSGERHGEYIIANHIQKFLTYFCNSNAQKVQELNYRDIIADKQALTFVSNFYPAIEKGTRSLLAKMHNGEIDITHDFYLKMFQLSKPALSFDYILFDEGQDASPAMLDVFLAQQSIKVIVGDAHQQIYGWRHAINSLASVSYPVYHLSESFRFGQEIANFSMEILSWKAYLQPVHTVNILGNARGEISIHSKATIARTNLGLLLSAISFIRQNENARLIYFEGNINSYTYADEGASLYDVLYLFNGNRSFIRDKLIASMRSVKELEEYISKTEDRQLSMMVDIVREYGNEIPSLIKKLKTMHVGNDEKDKAEMIFSTVHRAKGMEYDEVTLADDFITESEIKRAAAIGDLDPLALSKCNEEINLLYVAVTRARRRLYIPAKIYPVAVYDTSIIVQAPAVAKDDGERTMETQRTNLTKKPRRKKQSTEDRPAYSYTEKRLDHKNAYERWTGERDTELKLMFYQGINIKDLATHFGRNPGAIRSRLKKIGCDQFD